MSGADKKDDDDGWQKLTQQELDVILDKHLEFVKGTRGGERAKLGMMDASYLDFSGRDLSRADLVGAMLCHCEMEETNRGSQLVCLRSKGCRDGACEF